MQQQHRAACSFTRLLFKWLRGVAEGWIHGEAPCLKQPFWDVDTIPVLLAPRLWYVVKTCCERAGLEHIAPHDLRRTCAKLCDLQEYLTERRKEIDRKYDYRYSHLTQVFGRLLYETRVSEEELRGFSEDKLKTIRSFAKFLAEDAA